MTERVVVAEIPEEAWAAMDTLHIDYVSKRRQPGEFTTGEWSARYYPREISNLIAYRELCALYKDGKVTRRNGKADTGHACVFWKLIE